MSDVFVINGEPLILKLKYPEQYSKILDEMNDLEFWEIEGDHLTISVSGIEDYRVGQEFFIKHVNDILNVTWFTDSDEGGHFFARINNGKYEKCGIVSDEEWEE